MKHENSSENAKKSYRLHVIIAVSAAAVAALILTVILLPDGNEAVPDGTGTASVTVTDTEPPATGTELFTDASDTALTTDAPEPDDVFTPVSETVTAKELTNLRTEPSYDAEIAAILANGDTATRTGISDSGWSRLEYSGQVLYAITSYLTADLDYKPIEIPQADVVEGNTFTPQAGSVTAKEYTNLRALPTTDSEIVGTLVSGDFLERTAVSDKGWSRLIYNGQTVYAVTSLLSDEVVPPYVAPDGFEETDEQVTAKQETNLRTAPSFHESEIVHTLKNGEYVRRIAVNTASGWSRLEWNGQTVYAVSSYLEVQADGE